MADRPLSVLSKGERNALDLLDTPGLVAHYEDIFASRFRFENGPEGMEPDWPLRQIFRHGLIGTAEAFGEWQIAGGRIGLHGIYEQPLNWFPECDATVIPEGWMKAHEGPTAHLPFVPREEIFPLCLLMAEAWRTMRQNIKAMAQPILVQGTAGAEINAKECKDAVDGFRPVVFTLDRSAVEPKAVDLGGKDHTESLIKVINDLDCEILARMGIRSAGTEKASGVTTEETLSIAQELRLRLEREYMIYDRFCREVQDRLPGLKVVVAPGLMDPTGTNGSNNDNQDSKIKEADYENE